MFHNKGLKCITLLMAMVIFLSGCALPGLSATSKDTLVIGNFEMAEAKTLSRVIKKMVEEETDLDVEIVNNLGSDGVVQKAMESGEVDIASVRYTGSVLAGTLGRDLIKDPDEAFDLVKSEMDEQFNMTWFGSYGFDNSYAFTVKEEMAEEENLEKVSDLEAIADEVDVGVDTDWMQREGIGYDVFQEKYGFDFPNINPMQLGLVYQAVDSGKMDVVLAYTSDGRLDAFNLVTLEDDERLFPPYDASPVVRNEILEKHPEIGDILDRLEGKISPEMIQQMNNEVDVEMKEPSTVAEEFVEEHDLLN